MKILDRENLAIKALMATHLGELMGDVELYGWEAMNAFNTVWLQQIDQGHDRPGYQPQLPLSPGVAPVISLSHQARPASLAQQEKATRETASFNVMVKPGTTDCTTYNKVRCTSGAQHPKEVHVCSFCLSFVNRLYAHQERFCRRRLSCGVYRHSSYPIRRQPHPT